MKSRDSCHLDSKNDGTPASSDGELEQETSFTNFGAFKASKGFSNPILDFAGTSSGEDDFEEFNSKEKKQQCRISKAKEFR